MMSLLGRLVPAALQLSPQFLQTTAGRAFASQCVQLLQHHLQTHTDCKQQTLPNIPVALLPLLVLTPALTAQADEQAPPQASATSFPVSETAVHPLDYDPVTNEHTAKMTLARNSAMEYYQAGKYRQAEAKFLEALEEAKLGFPAKDPHIASAHNNLAEFYRNVGKHDKAEKLYREALELLESNFGQKHWMYVSTLHNLAMSLEALKDYSRAKAVMEQVLKLRKEMFGVRHFSYADSLFAMAHILKSMGGHDKQALHMMKDAVTALEDTEGPKLDILLYWIQELVEHYKQRGQVADAITYMRKAVALVAREKGDEVAQASQLTDQLVDLLRTAKRYTDAHAVMSDCVKARITKFGKELVVAQSLLKLAEIEVQLNKPATRGEAQQHASDAAKLAQELLSEYNRRSFTIVLSGADVNKIHKRLQAAHIVASCLRLLADLHNKEGAAAAAESELQRAVDALQAAATSTKAFLQGGKVDAAFSRQRQKITLSELTSSYVEVQLLLMETLERLADLLTRSSREKESERIQALQARAEQIARELL